MVACIQLPYSFQQTEFIAFWSQFILRKRIIRIKMSQDYNIRVVCRLRPLNKIEMGHGGECCVKFSDKSIQISVGDDENKYEFGFDKIFAPQTQQVSVYDEVAKPILNAVLTGFNGTVFAYGQTGGGKTWTMEGPNHDDPELKGLIPRMMEGLFEKIQAFDESFEFAIKCSYIEIYNEKIMDLLDPSKNKLQVKEDKQRGIFIQDCTEIYVSSVSEMRNTMHRGSMNRKIAFTGMNERSSRSHSIFIVHLSQKDTKKGSSKMAKLYFVDLAGSEKVSKTGVTGQQLEEAKNINKSLSCLGNVINALTSEKKEHVPYRDSKLTRILQESIGGNSRTTLIINCSMCSYNDKETLSTLRFGYRAKSIKNKPLVNQEKSAKQLQILLDHAKKTILQLQEQLRCGGKGISVADAQSELKWQQEKERLEAKIQDLKDELQNRSDPVDNSFIVNDLEIRIKQLVLENNSLSDKYKTDVDKLDSQNKKHIQTIESLFTKEATLEKLLNRLKTDLNFLKLNLKYDEKLQDQQSQNKSLQSIDCILKDIVDFAEFLTITNEKLTAKQQQQKSLSRSSEQRKPKYEMSLSEPNLHEVKNGKNFEEISCIIKEKMNEENNSEGNKEEENENSTQIETLINQFNKENEQRSKHLITDLTRQNDSLQKVIQELKIKCEEAVKDFKVQEKKLEEFYDDVLKRANSKIQELFIKIEAKEDQIDQLQVQLAASQKECIDEKALTQKLLKIIEGNHDMNERYKMQTKTKEYAIQRQKLFNQLYQLRERLDDAEMNLKEKDDLIFSLKNVMKSSYEPSAHCEPIVRVPVAPQMVRREYNQTILGVESKNVVKTIKGGGAKPSQQSQSIVEEIKKSSLRNKLGKPEPKKTGFFRNLFS